MPSFHEKIPKYKQIGPWIGAIIILSILFWRIEPNPFFVALRHADLSIYLPLIVFFIILWFLLESQNLWALLKHFGHKVPFTDMLALRGVTYFLMLINFYLSAGGITYYLKRDQGIPLLRGASLMFFYTVITQLSLYIMTILGCIFLQESSSLINGIFWIAMIALVGYICGFIMFYVLPRKGVFEKVKDNPLLEIFAEASLKNYIILTLWRIVYYTTFIFLFYGAAKAFYMDIPIGVLAAYVPIILFLVGLPITPFGLGTVQAAMILFFKDYGSEATILAFGITYSASIALLRGILGLFYVGKLGK